jgi:hypothetical protein
MQEVKRKIYKILWQDIRNIRASICPNEKSENEYCQEWADIFNRYNEGLEVKCKKDKGSNL